ncbi:MAG: hypothetical protein R3D68_00300 [Hyphomicrobiaceae bacterium]
MQAVEIQDYARRLYEARGASAVADAAQKAAALEALGQKDEAQDWRRIEAALRMMKGPGTS